MPITDEGFKLVEIPPVTEEVLASYDRCPPDPYMGNLTRYKRFSQYRVSHKGDEGWHFEKLPHRAYTAFKKFNSIGGGMRRPYEPLEVDLTPWARFGVESIPLDPSEDWQLNVHQNRSRATLEKPGQLTPEGIHQDGHEYVMIAILRRHNVVGGETRLWRPDATEPFWTGTLDPGQALLLDDRAILHDVTDIEPENGQPGHRDILIVAFSRWREKWYGEEHDAAVLADGEPVVSAM
jgi:hypothetical protein